MVVALGTKNKGLRLRIRRSTVIIAIVCLAASAAVLLLYAAWHSTTSSMELPLNDFGSRIPPLSAAAGDDQQPIVPQGSSQKSSTKDSSNKEEDTITFPAPSELASPNAHVILTPTYGTHRPDHDAVFAFAEGYKLNTYVGFVESLRHTGFDGDIVLSVSSVDKLAPNVDKYLKSRTGVVIYTAKWECWKKNGDKINDKGGMRSTTNNGFSDCQITGLYGDESSGQSDMALKDPRPARPVATARYELYWAWSTHYDASSRILLIDVRDTYFQRNPFTDLPPVLVTSTADASKGGVLRLYEENAFATSAASSVGASKYNSRWVSGAYGQEALNSVRDEPVICSGSTIGDAAAIEPYLRAMVAQFDETGCKMVGCDQGLHNYLYYSGRLGRTSGVRHIVTYKQGEGAVNNLAALRNSPLRKQGVLQEGTDLVLNWDGTVSPVAHQYDRDKELERIVKRRVDAMVAELGL